MWRAILGHRDPGIVSKINRFGAYLLYYLREESQIWCVDVSWDDGVSHIVFWSL